MNKGTKLPPKLRDGIRLFSLDKPRGTGKLNKRDWKTIGEFVDIVSLGTVKGKNWFYPPS